MEKKLVLQNNQNILTKWFVCTEKWSFLRLFIKFLAAAFWENYFIRNFPVPANRIESVFLPRNASEQNSESCIYFCSTERDSEMFSLLRNGSMEFREFASIFVPYYTEFWAFISSAEGFGTEYREFSVPWYKPFVSSILSSAELFFVVNSQPYLRSFGSKCLKDVTDEIFIDKFSYFAQLWLDFSVITMFSVFVRHVTGTGSGLLGGIPRLVVQISALT